MTTAPHLPPALPEEPFDTASAVADAGAHVPTLRAVPVTTEPLVSLEDALRRVAPRLLRYAERRIGNAHEAEEVVQEALLRAFQHRPGFETEDDLMAWSTVVTGRLVIDRLRVRSRSISVAEMPEGIRTGRDTADVVVARDEARAALDALEAMPARQASVLWAREVEGMSYDDIAERYGLSEPTVRSLLHRARRTLRREYAARGGTLPVAGLVALIAPWRTGLHKLGRLHAVAKQSLAPASMAAATLSMALGVLVIAVPGHKAPTIGRPAVVVTDSAKSHKPLAHHVTAGVPASSLAAAGTTAGGGHGSVGIAGVSHVPAPPVCASDQQSGHNVGVNCSVDTTTPVLVISVPLPMNPVGVTQLGTTSDKINCGKLPTLPLTQCETQPGSNS